MNRLLQVWTVLLFAFTLLAQTTRAAEEFVAVVELRGVVNPALAGYVVRALDEAESREAHAVVITMDTPGGLDESMRRIVQRILASRIPVIVYVSPPGARAGSAGVFITYAAHVAAMAPNTNIGSATPVLLGGEGQQAMPEALTQKVMNDAVAYIRALATERGRNADWAEKAVREGANVPADEARALGVVDLVAGDLRELLVGLDGRVVRTAVGPVTLRTAGLAPQTLEMSLVEELLQVISDPTVAYLLISLGSLALIYEFANPGQVLPGAFGGIAILVGLYGLGTLPVNWAGLMLIGLGMLLFLADVLATGHGVLTVGGIIAVALGSLMLIQVPSGQEYLRVSLAAVAGVVATMGAFALFALLVVTRSQRRRPTTGREGLIGQVGRVTEPLGPKGMVFVDGALWQAVSVEGPIAQGHLVRVVGVDGLTLLVRAAEAREQLPAPSPVEGVRPP